MGYSVDMFIDKNLKQEFICSICRDVLQDPIMVPCGHAFCRTCILRWIDTSPTCPIDRKPIQDSRGLLQLNPPPLIYMNLLNELKMQCSFKDAGCTATIDLGDFQNHWDRCDFNPENHEECSKGCGKIVKLLDRANHNCIAYLKNEILDLEEELEYMLDELTVEQQQNKATRKELSKKENELDNARTELNKKIKDLRDTRKELKKTVKELEATRKELEAKANIENELKKSREELEACQLKIGELERELRLEGEGGSGPAAEPPAKKGRCHHESQLPVSAQIWDPQSPITSSDIYITNTKNVPQEVYVEITKMVLNLLQTTFPANTVGPVGRIELGSKIRKHLMLGGTATGKYDWTVRVAQVGLAKSLTDTRLEERAETAPIRLDLSVRDLKLLFFSKMVETDSDKC